jgi:TerC family integral membrane protein
MTDNLLLWLGFGLFVLVMMALDLGVFHRKAHKVGLREAAVWTGVWVSLALAFNAVIYFWRGTGPAVEFLTGYIIEWSLSMDNVFVFAVIFSYFAVPPQYQHRVLFWGILGAVVMRIAFIVAGVTMLERFHWMIYVMGGFLVLTGVKLFLDRNKKCDVGKNLVLRFARRYLPVTADYVGQKFFVRQSAAVVEPISRRPDDGPPRQAVRWLATPLLLVLLVVESTDVVFAVDSIPAILAVTRDPFIVFTSNVFAILGLRALYFLLAGAIELFRYLSAGLALILCFIGTKMLVSGFYDIPIGISLGVVCGILAVANGASLLVTRLESGRAVCRRLDEHEPAQAEKEEIEVKI